MKNITILFALILYSATLFAQDVTTAIQELRDNGKCDEVINKYTQGRDTLPTLALCFISECYDRKGDMAKSEEYLDLAIKKGPADPLMYSNKASFCMMREDFKSAIMYLKKIIDLKPEDSLRILPGVYSYIGENYAQMGEFQTAIEYLKMAITYSTCPIVAYSDLGTIYEKLKDYENALNYLKIAYEKAEPGSDLQVNVSFNYGVALQLHERYSDAVKVFIKHEEQNPKDYHVTAKVVQCYYELGEFEKAKPYKDKIYTVQKNEEMPRGMEESFIIDQFIWKSNRIMVFERYAVSNTKTNAKFRFYVTGSGAAPSIFVDAETSMKISLMGKDVKYMLVLTKDGKRYKYPQFLYPENFNYAEMKSAVMQILKGKVEPKEEEEE